MKTTLALLLALLPLTALSATPRLNVLFITADDMNYNSPGVTGCLTPGITPNLDRLASQGIRFVNAHVTVAVCQPSRECLMTGRYPHRNGATGFYPVRQDVPTLAESLKAAGYQIGIMAKIEHLKPDTSSPGITSMKPANSVRGAPRLFTIARPKSFSLKPRSPASRSS